ncbi:MULTISPECIES: phosphomannomutase/phosphoglucomutase [unclassified Arthrobacter]|uniref:phosphomannomutase/phosphoglucomutase n=1 Tax=unclassified Arthrobacter TaxID=235627 RepID=UPI001D1530AC|nr:phosphomannomutase/phosphoglucomutase [Arthrobacter sp. zg-Y1110]MCC3292271.1 phosphomannomutase/phosphoglucomutase [Arthrobacter sp. zg-Y1110]MCC3302644.1 phosphomannomutase/phosphoglucomutase [Arthrobacter sp. zg-Y895]UWX85353.1 phosphomannomutase/phosphoglucomutase [Arthrobacter sp. zg-Y1110]
MNNAFDLSASFKAYDVRGVVGETITPQIVEAVGAAFVDVQGLSGQTVLVGGDMRPSSPEFIRDFARGATARGADVLLLDLISTDELYYACGVMNAAGVTFTASHNPAQYNGIKMAKAGAVPISSETGLKEIQALAEQYLNEGVIPAAAAKGSISVRDVLSDYAKYLRNLVDLSGIRPLKVVVDAGNGMAGMTTPAVLGDSILPGLPLDIVPLYFELDGSFPNHPANPLEPENLRDLQAAVVEHGADIGLAFDGDADRCFVIDEKGEPVSPSAVTALVARREIARAKAAGEETPVIIHNLITSRAVPELVAHDGGRAVRTRVGHSFIKAVMASEGAVFGGEHSAHYYFRDFYNADTGMLAAMHVLAALGEQSRSLSDLAREYEPYISSGEVNSRVEDVPAAVARVRAEFERDGVTVDTLDGVTFTADDGAWWFNLRASNTEPFLRLNAEAEDLPTMERVRDHVLKLVRK